MTESIKKQTLCLAEGKALMLRSCRADGTSYNGFQWPLTVGETVVSPDWNELDQPGNGLHGCLWGDEESAFSLYHADHNNCVWMVCEVNESEIVNVTLGKKSDYCIKVPRCVVVCVGDIQTCNEFITPFAPDGIKVMGRINYSGRGKNSIVGNLSTARVEGWGVAYSECYGTSEAGPGGISITGAFGSATTNHDGVAVASYGGMAVAGINSVAIAGRGGIVAGAKNSILIIRSNNDSLKTAFVDGVNIKAYVNYELDSEGKFVECKTDFKDRVAELHKTEKI